MEQTTIIPPSYLPMVVETEQTTNIGETIIDAEIITEDTRSPFIEANSIPITLESLQNDCVIPNFAKDNEAVISHSQFIGATYQALRDFYRSELKSTYEMVKADLDFWGKEEAEYYKHY